MREKYESLALADLKGIAKARGMKGVSTMKKAQLVEAMLAQDEKDKAAKQSSSAGEEHSGRQEEKQQEGRVYTERKQEERSHVERKSEERGYANGEKND